MPYQARWLLDRRPLRLMEKSRQIGITLVDALDSVLKATHRSGLDVWVSSRDETQAQLYLKDCRVWAERLRLCCADRGFQPLPERSGASASVLEFANGRRIYSLSSNPNALAGKRGHVKLDEFALHQDQRLLYQVAKPVTTWGGQLSLISTHRGEESVFHRLIREIRERGNPMGWSLHSVTLAQAVGQGLLTRLNRRTGRNESPAGYLARIRAECIDEEQWLQEYCCVPASERTSFLSYELITACEAPGCLQPIDVVARSPHPLFVGVDVARKHDLCVIDVGELIGDIVWDRLRLEMSGRTFAEIEHELFQILAWRQVKRVCLDATGLGAQLAERAARKFHWKVEPVVFTAAVKEELAFGLRTDFEGRRLRIPQDDHPLVADLRGMRKEVTAAGGLRFAGEAADSHCDRFWAKALRQMALRHRPQVFALVG
jgi:phage FluMu gp28-like protein